MNLLLFLLFLTYVSFELKENMQILEKGFGMFVLKVSLMSI